VFGTVTDPQGEPSFDGRVGRRPRTYTTGFHPEDPEETRGSLSPQPVLGRIAELLEPTPQPASWSVASPEGLSGPHRDRTSAQNRVTTPPTRPCERGTSVLHSGSPTAPPSLFRWAVATCAMGLLA
jgi:hypothetical protein